MQALRLITAAAVLAATGAAQATVIDFNSLAHSDYYHGVNPLTIDGFNFACTPDSGESCLGVWGKDQPYQADPGAAAVFTNYGSATVVMTQVGGGAFDLASIDFADVYNTGAVVNVLVTFNPVVGPSSTMSFWTDSTPGLQTVVFSQTGLSSVTWQTVGGADPWNQWDNVTVGAIPEPGTYALMALGLAGVAAAARRRRTA